MMVLIRCAMVSTVQSANWVRIVDWIRPSVSGSTDAVASSRISTLVLRSKARARHISCFWPTLCSTRRILHKLFSIKVRPTNPQPNLYLVLGMPALSARHKSPTPFCNRIMHRIDLTWIPWNIEQCWKAVLHDLWLKTRPEWRLQPRRHTECQISTCQSISGTSGYQNSTLMAAFDLQGMTSY